jgi:hypothetical protein
MTNPADPAPEPPTTDDPNLDEEVVLDLEASEDDVRDVQGQARFGPTHFQ